MRSYLYPKDLTAQPTLWLWKLRDLAVCAVFAIPGCIAFSAGGSTLLLILAALFLFLSVQVEGYCILDFVKASLDFYLLRPQSYRWSIQQEEGGEN